MTSVPAQPNLLLHNPRLVLPDRVLERGSLLIESGRIVSVVPFEVTKQSSANADTIALDGLTLFPGFIDVHIHGAVGVDTMEASVEQLTKLSQFLLTQGVTGWLPTLVPGSHETYSRAISEVDQLMVDQEEQTSEVGARVLGIHYEGPFVNDAQCGALHTEYFKTYSKKSELDELPLLQTPGARMMTTLAPEIEGGLELVRALESRKWILSLGHTRATSEVLDSAFEAGAHHMTHFMNAMAPLHHRSPGPIAWGLMRDDVTCDVIADGIHLDPFMLQLILKVKEPRRLSLISDAIAAAGMGDVVVACASSSSGFRGDVCERQADLPFPGVGPRNSRHQRGRSEDGYGMDKARIPHPESVRAGFGARRAARGGRPRSWATCPAWEGRAQRTSCRPAWRR